MSWKPQLGYVLTLILLKYMYICFSVWYGAILQGHPRHNASHAGNGQARQHALGI